MYFCTLCLFNYRKFKKFVQEINEYAKFFEKSISYKTFLDSQFSLYLFCHSVLLQSAKQLWVKKLQNIQK